MPSAYSNTFEAHREQFGVVPSSARSSSGTRGASKTVGDTTPKAKVPSTHQEGRPPTTTSTLPRIPVPPKSADGRRYTSASERRASEMPTRPGSSSQTQLVMTLLRNASASSSSARTPHGTAGMMLHTPTSSPALPSNVTGGTPQLMTEALLSLRASGADRISSWPLVATPSNGPKEGWTLNSSPRKDMSAPPSASSLPASTTTTTTGKRHHQPYSGPLHQALSRELVGIRLAHNRGRRCLHPPPPPPPGSDTISPTVAHSTRRYRGNSSVSDLPTTAPCVTLRKQLDRKMVTLVCRCILATTIIGI
ncbi:unnamed protein product [Bodo saltans]|uniref:Uncharacterized protein n=1 Tax=Bodo saltans TaxID=75058 RepID=A0A0S4KKK3_BODSA|nr:unnamed protein product [Bodo saltans]|eukprot:CUI14995.1 unnamed protein product [Bodo saltans]